jgi:hypothetical protein
MNPAEADGLFLHSSAVKMNERALLFMGHSTAGKSTLARLLSQRVPVLADDSVFAYRGSDHLWRVVDGGFRFGEGDLTDWQDSILRRMEAGEGVPLAGCLRIHKGNTLRIESLPSLEIARCLMDAVMEIDLQRKCGRPGSDTESRGNEFRRERELRRQWFGQVAEIARSIPGGSLWFSTESDASALCDAFRRHILSKNA